MRVTAPEGVGKQGGVAVLSAVVQVSGRGLDMGMAHSRLDLDERGLVDRHRAEEVPQRVEREGAQAGALGGVDEAAS